MEAHNIKQEFTKIYDRESDALFRYCIMRVSDKEKAIDIVQDIFAELWKAVNGAGKKIENERAYLFTLAHNRIIDWYRKKKTESLDALMENEDNGKPFDHQDEQAYSNIIFSAEAKQVLEKIETLEPIYKDVLYLRFAEDLPPEEIGKILGENANTISVRITRGLEKLREQFHI